MHGRNTAPNADSPELRAKRMYQRVITQWAGDYLLCRSILTQSGSAHHNNTHNADRFAPAIYQLGED